ncbi:MAG: ribonuclease HI family protein [Proteobacteria bacterium]|nr:ribonuclease HI family protein [Pseudomonadota bacterium]
MSEADDLFGKKQPDDSNEWWTLHTDGAARGNPGPAGAGAVLRDPAGATLAEVSRPLGKATNNEAEYQALILGLEEASRLGARRLRLRLDSELVVRQVTGVYRVKNDRLQPLFQRVRALLRNLEAYDILHIRRELNSEADALASRAASRNTRRG